MNDNTPIWQLTVGELKAILKKAENAPAPPEQREPDEYCYGLEGLADLLKVSRTTAGKIRQTGSIDRATITVGRQLIFNKKKVMELLKQKTA